MYLILVYIVLLLGVSFYKNKKWNTEVLSVGAKRGWVITGLSLFMYFVSVDYMQLCFEVIRTQGLWGMWLYWASMISVFVVPLVFAPLWRRLDLRSDNDFILTRFSGNGAKTLYLFRAYYVGVLIIPVVISLHVLAFSKLLTAYFGYGKPVSLGITAVLLLLFAVKNSLAIKMRTDVLHATLYIFAMVLLIYYVQEGSGGFFHAISVLESAAPHRLQVWPKGQEQYFYALALLGVQWWSVHLFDGSGPEMIRFSTSRNEREAVRTGILGVLLYFISNAAIVAGIMMLLSVQTNYSEIDDFHTLVKKTLPSWTAPILLLGWFSIFISTCESLLLWSVGMWAPTINARVSGKSGELPPYFLFLAMLAVSLLAVLSAFTYEYLYEVTKWFFVLSAGVAPLFVLRWFYYRINAWTQLSSMVSIPVLVAIYSLLPLEGILPFVQNETGGYIWKMLIITVLSLLTALIVGSLTVEDDTVTIRKFRRHIPPVKDIFRVFMKAILLGFGCFFLWIFLWSLLFS
jgi:Na+/proline symporter